MEDQIFHVLKCIRHSKNMICTLTKVCSHLSVFDFHLVWITLAIMLILDSRGKKWKQEFNLGVIANT